MGIQIWVHGHRNAECSQSREAQTSAGTAGMKLLGVLLAVLAQGAAHSAHANPYDQFDPQTERLGKGPHILIISDGQAITRINYKTGQACLRARDEARRQASSNKAGVGQIPIYGATRFTAVCIPR